MSSLLEAGRESPLQLRLFRPPEGTADRGGASGLSPNMTVSEFFHAFVLPLYLKAKSRDAKTVAEYTTAVGRWAELTGDPSLCQVDQATCAAFVVADLAVMSTKVKTKKLSPNTVRKHCTHLQMVLDLAGPLTRERPEAATSATSRRRTALRWRSWARGSRRARRPRSRDCRSARPPAGGGR